MYHVQGGRYPTCCSGKKARGNAVTNRGYKLTNTSAEVDGSCGAVHSSVLGTVYLGSWALFLQTAFRTTEELDNGPPPGPRHYTGIIPSLSLPITGNSCRTVSMKLEMVSLLPSQSFNTGWAGFELRSLKFHYSGKWAHSYSEVAPNVIVWNIIVPWPGILRQKQGSISNHRELNTNYIWASLSVVGLLTRCPILDWVSICRSKDRATAISLATLDTIQLYRWSRGY